MKKNITISSTLLEAINHLCNYREIKILLATLCYDGRTPTSTQMSKMTGIVPPNNYFRARKQLIDMGYLILDDSGMHINVEKILSDYANSPS